MDYLMCMLSYGPVDGEEQGFNETKITFPLQNVYESTERMIIGTGGGTGYLAERSRDDRTQYQCSELC